MIFSTVPETLCKEDFQHNRSRFWYHKRGQNYVNSRVHYILNQGLKFANVT